MSSPGDDVLQVRCDSTDGHRPVKIVAGGGSVTLEWTGATGAASYEVLRELAAKRGRASVLWRGTGRSFVDHSVPRTGRDIAMSFAPATRQGIPPTGAST